MPGSVFFNAFVLSLATTAAVHFDDVSDSSSGKETETNIESAWHAIEMLVLLEEKTKGNISEEYQFIKQVRYELRVRYVEATRSKKS
jgi:hypothetical protein